MTNKEALQSLTEYDNNNLLEKILLDRGVTTSSTYSAGNSKTIDLCASDLYGVLVGHPELKEGSMLIKYDAIQLRAMSKEILRKYGLDAVTGSSHLSSGNALW